MKLDLKAFALAGGLFWGSGIVLLTWWLLLTRDKRGRGSRYGELIGRIYPGYRGSPKGSVIGLVWGVIDGFAAAGIFRLLYNHFAKKRDSGRPGQLPASMPPAVGAGCLPAPRTPVSARCHSPFSGSVAGPERVVPDLSHTGIY
ncbi:MAG: hypothetical protein CVV35_01200 [Methanomicrobiales archaeon HGW-Methanomicrobiales-6]|jgi:hypothetical protein|nr:MAG: hypothetical protein CVV35_01200 [Methanomicrobiales archaeon HGW-Methanomicrobiales-6]